jgi:hypothetical protein
VSSNHVDSNSAGILVPGTVASLTENESVDERASGHIPPTGADGYVFELDQAR